MYKHDAHMVLLSEAILQHVMSTFLLYHDADGKKFPYVIPMGGSTPLGTVGLVNAAFELKEQINQGLLPEPDVIYIPFGSMGSTAGLALGLKAAGLKSQVVAVSVVSPDNFNYKKLEQLFTKTNELLRSKDESFPLCKMDNVTLRTEFFSGTYGKFSTAGNDAITCAYDQEDLNLDGTYSANAMAALIHDAKAGSVANKKVLFWNTFYDAPADAQYYYSPLKPCFHKYFEDDVQETDQP
jgi:D-cysteine desulfhydrase